VNSRYISLCIKQKS